MRAAMVNPLLERAPPKAFAERGQVIEKKEKLELFPRLTEVVEADLSRLGEASRAWRQAEVAFRLAFGWADTEHDLPVLEGRAAVGIPAVCQRCLERFELPLAADFRLLFRGPDGPLERGLTPRDSDTGPYVGHPDESLEYEVWELDGPTVRPLDVLDEALVMAMPFAAVHASEEECGPLAGRAKYEDEVPVRPFADLKSRLRDRK